MKQYWKTLLVTMVLCIPMPWFTTAVGSGWMDAGETLKPSISTPLQPEQTTRPTDPTTCPEETEPPTEPTEPSTEPTDPPTEPAVPEYTLPITVIDKNGLEITMELETYVLGVMLAEMPARFETEALKAQAVAIRTFTLRCTAMKKKHKGAVCMRSSCCQGYLSKEGFYGKGGKASAVEKVRAAVEQTENVVVTYCGELIQAAYFSCSGGSTENAVDVWGGDVPYLQAVPSPGEESASVFSKTKEFTPESFAKKLGCTLTGTPDSWIGAVTYTEGGGVDTIVIGGVTYTGKKMRSLLSLNSTKFTITADGDSVTVTTSGYGHRVGLSQHGANAMAKLGNTYEQILKHYFQGTELTKWIS